MGKIASVFITISILTVVGCLEVSSEDFAGIKINPKELSAWLKRLADDPFFTQESSEDLEILERYIHEDESVDSFYSMRDEVEKLTETFNSKIQAFPANDVVIQAMYMLMNPKGVLKQEGFTRWGTIKSNGRGKMMWTRAFTTEEELLDTLNNSTGKHLTSLQVAVGDIERNKPLVAVANYILSVGELARLKIWLAEKYKMNGEHLRHSIRGNRTMVIVEYACCSETNNELLKPYYGILKLKVG